MLAKHIQVEEKKPYGTIRYAPLCETSKEFCKLKDGQKTLTPANIESIKRIGFKVWRMVRDGNSYVKVGEL